MSLLKHIADAILQYIIESCQLILDKRIERRKERLKITSRLWKLRNKERWNAYQRELRRNNPDRVRAYRKAYIDKNPERFRQLTKLSNIRRKPKIREWYNAWYSRNKAKVRIQKNGYERSRRTKDPAFRCLKLLRNRVLEVLKYQKTIKTARTLELIGCDREFLKQWIESRFTEGMTWENHGVRGWHIDHIRPCASFDLTDRKQQKQCFNYTNLQPLWAKQNRIKGDRIVS